MNKLSSKTIKKTLIGILISDGSLNKTPNSARFDFYNKQEAYSKHVSDVLSSITGSGVQLREKKDRRFGTKGYRVFTRTHRYFSKLYDIFYKDGEKVLTKEILQRVDEEALAHIWMCDGMLHFNWRKKRNDVQIHGYFCLESFSKEELEDFRKMLKINFNIESSMLKVTWGKGWRIKVGGANLRKIISIIYPYILDCFKYKCNLYYKDSRVLNELPNTEQFVTIYKDLSEIEDIVRTRRNP